MDKTTRRNHLTVVPPSPRLVRSRSGSSPAAAITTPDRVSRRFSSSERFTDVQRSKSLSRTRTTNSEGINNTNLNPTLVTSFSSKSTNNRVQEKKIPRDDNFNNVGASKKTISTRKSPSAWALSPGRWSLGSPFGTHLPAKVTNSSGGSSNGSVDSSNGSVGSSVTKVFKYFKQRKVSYVREEEYHRFRILHNRLSQWRFINARTKVVMDNVKNIAEIQLFSVWLRILTLRKISIQKRMELQKVKHVMKLYEILEGQLYLLSEWAKLERINQDSVGRLTRKLSAMSNLLPLTDHVVKVERILYQITELTTTLKQEEEYLQEVGGLVPLIATLLENDKSIRVHLIQTKMKSNTRNYLCTSAQRYVFEMRSQ
ncbi:hypothetical protein Fmac_010328 [Flemingia macrophylla]|uniref:QWRF motif-containing protein 7 n=1 Tax=Flemingia macrophylla TaxID=520843 RepID=A0ABD1MK05_9FABA